MACRYANSSQQAIAARAEQQGLLIEGFNAQRLAQEQAKLPNGGKGRHNEQVNILNLPMPDFDVSGASPWTSLSAHAAFPGSMFMPLLPRSPWNVMLAGSRWPLQQLLLQESDSSATPARVFPEVKAIGEVLWAGAGEGELIQLPADLLQGPPKGMSASEEAGEAVEPAGSQVQSGESGSLPHVRRPALLLLQELRHGLKRQLRVTAAPQESSSSVLCPMHADRLEIGDSS